MLSYIFACMCSPATRHSYKFVEDSVKQGKLQDLRKYEAGPSAPRPVGATDIPSRSHKRAYTIEDDQILWDWMQPYEHQKTAPISGNMIYQDLAARVSTPALEFENPNIKLFYRSTPSTHSSHGEIGI